MDKLTASVTVSEYEMVHDGWRQQGLPYIMQQLQHEMGSGLVARLCEGPAVISLTARDETNLHWGARRFDLVADVRTVESIMTPIYLPHFEYFPMDWVCDKCGCIVDGIREPRQCNHCNAPRTPKRIW